MAQTYKVSGTLNHGVLLDEKGPDGRNLVRVDTYHDGDDFSTDDPKLEAELRAVKTLLTAEEYAAEQAAAGNPAVQAELAATRQALEDENAALKARLAEFEAASQGSSKAPKSVEK